MEILFEINDEKKYYVHFTCPQNSDEAAIRSYTEFEPDKYKGVPAKIIYSKGLDIIERTPPVTKDRWEYAQNILIFGMVCLTICAVLFFILT